MPGRSPAMTAMTAATLDQLSGGRMLLGIGPSGPQVADGWHGQRFGRQIQRTREYVTVVRQALRREHRAHTAVAVRVGAHDDRVVADALEHRQPGADRQALHGLAQAVDPARASRSHRVMHRSERRGEGQG